MYKRNKIMALIPARGGSKGIKLKNIRPLLGKPLINWTIEQAFGSSYIDNVVVSTDDPKIAEVAVKSGAEVPFLRPKFLATDKARSIDVITHALDFFKGKGVEYDYLVLLEPTSPLRESADIDKATELLIGNRFAATSIVSVSKVGAAHPAFDVMINKKGLVLPYEADSLEGKRRQDIKELYFFDGTIYMSKVSALIKKRSFYHENTMAYIVPKWKSFEVDDIVDWVCIGSVLRNIKTIKRETK